MKDGNLFALMIVALGVAFMTWIATYNTVNARWEIDCQKLGKTVTNGKVYECSTKDTK